MMVIPMAYIDRKLHIYYRWSKYIGFSAWQDRTSVTRLHRNEILDDEVGVETAQVPWEKTKARERKWHNLTAELSCRETEVESRQEGHDDNFEINCWSAMAN